MRCNCNDIFGMADEIKFNGGGTQLGPPPSQPAGSAKIIKIPETINIGGKKFPNFIPGTNEINLNPVRSISVDFETRTKLVPANPEEKKMVVEYDPYSKDANSDEIWGIPKTTFYIGAGIAGLALIGTTIYLINK